MRLWTCWALIISLFACLAQAEEARNLVVKQNRKELPAKAGKKVALVIGNSAYANAPLQNPVNDARSMAALLKELGFEVLLRENLDQNGLRKSLRDFGDKLQKGSVALVYYAGHGMQIKGKNYLIPVGADIQREDEVEDRALDAALVMQKLETAQTSVNIIILDACRNNPFTRSFGAGGGLAVMEAPSGSLLAFATAPGKVASDGADGNGLYTRHLLSALRMPGVKLEDVFKRVRVAVEEESDGRQTPWENTSLKGDFYFIPPKAGVSADADLAYWQSIQNSPLSSDFAAYLRVFPDGKFIALAKEREFALRGSNKSAKARKDCWNCPPMVELPAGRFVMGGADDDKDAGEEEKPAHAVVITKPFAISQTEITFDQYQACVAAERCSAPVSDEAWGKGRRPVINVSWQEAESYVRWLREKTGESYRLPSESEWEYAARAGGQARFPWGEDDKGICGQLNGYDRTGLAANLYRWQALSCDDGAAFTQEVASYNPNGRGLYDMLGNVWEWVADCWTPGYAGAPTDERPRAAALCSERVVRGGAWSSPMKSLRVSARFHAPEATRANMIGFRVVKDVRP